MGRPKSPYSLLSPHNAHKKTHFTCIPIEAKIVSYICRICSHRTPFPAGLRHWSYLPIYDIYKVPRAVSITRPGLPRWGHGVQSANARH